jgi:hypothetical protein
MVDRLDRLGEARVLAATTHHIASESVIAGMTLSLIAMAIAGLGFLPAVWGALLQEAIDVAVILNAMRVLRWHPHQVQLFEDDLVLSERFQGEHATIRAVLDEMKAVADALDMMPANEAMVRLKRIQHRLVAEIEPHEEAEEIELYPALDRAIGGTDPTGPMSRGHAEIAHRIRRLGRLLDEIGDNGPTHEELAELREVLYGLHAIVSLHTAQEDESYLSLGDQPRSPSAPGE